MKTAVHRLPGLVLTGHVFTLPREHSRPGGETIEVFAREVVSTRNEGEDLPWLLFLQGGPGFPSPRPMTESGWLKRALQDYRVLLLDQRGTGRSAPITWQTLARFQSAETVAGYLRDFRADAIIRDAEAIRCELLGERGTWSVLGQSYGGFCTTHYLSVAPDGLREAILTGGLPPIGHPVDDIYRATYRRVLERNRRFYERYPEDAERSADIVRHLAANVVMLPAGDRLTARRFQQLGILLGASDGMETLHYLLEDAFVNGVRGREPGLSFLRTVEALQTFDTHPIYALLHEACYCEGSASRWSAERVRAEFPQFDDVRDGGLNFTGEMIFPWMFEDYRGLAPLRDAAEILARYEGWPSLYDPAALRANKVPCAAAIYYDDMYVERAFSEETGAIIAGAQLWITNEYEHNALRSDGERLLDRLLAMAQGRVV